MRARLVAGGDQQLRTVYDKTSSPTAAVPFVFAVAAIAAHEKRHVVTADIPVAYLNADNSELGITMILEPYLSALISQLDPSYSTFQRADGSIIVRLHRAIYGCIESAKLWYNLLKSSLEENGFTANPCDPCVFNKTVNGVQITVLIYVDDLLLTCVDSSIINSTINALQTKFDSVFKVAEGNSDCLVSQQRAHYVH